MTKHALDTPQFYLTGPAPCPYINGLQERKVFTHLVGEKAQQINNMLTEGGFRRSQNIAYRPACDGCRACVSVRVVVDGFKPSRSFKRILHKNRNLVREELPTAPTAEQFSLFRRYLDDRHTSGGMAQMTALDYSMMVEDSHVETILIEYRRRGADTAITRKGDGPLIATSLTDVLSNGLSMVYSFFDTDKDNRSLGSYMILDHIALARKMGLPYVYLGYWIEGSKKMSYKARFQPLEYLTTSGWERKD